MFLKYKIIFKVSLLIVFDKQAILCKLFLSIINYFRITNDLKNAITVKIG